jgi:hypothetical protein
MAKHMPVGTQTQRADNSVWKKLDSGWKQLQDGDNSSRSKFKSQPQQPQQPSQGKTVPGHNFWASLRDQYDLDGRIPDESYSPEHVDIDVEGDIDSKPVLKWKSPSGKTMKSYTRAFHIQRAYALHKECGKYHDKIMKAMDTLEGLMNKQDAGAATAYASMVTGHRPSVFTSLTPDRMRVYRGDMKKSHALDYFIEKADSRDAMHPNRFHFMVEHPSQGAFISNIYDPALSDYAANGGSFAEPTEAFATVGLKDVDFSVIRHHANLRRAADVMSKSAPVKMSDADFHQGMSAVNQVIMNVSDAVARNYGHGKSPDGMVYMPVPMTVAAVDEAGGHQYWPDTFKKREDYVENRGLGMDLEQDVDEVLNEAGDVAESSEEGEGGDADVSSESDAADESEAGSDIEESDSDEEGLKKSYEGINFTPPAGVRAACRAGLKLKEEGHGGKGLVGATVAWARRLAAGQKISPAKARKMNAWFARHSVGSSSRTLGDKTSPAWVAWQLWGGNAGKSWSAKLVKQMESREKVGKSEMTEPMPDGIAIYMTPKYLKDVSPDVLKSLTRQVSAAANKEPSVCVTSPSVEKTSFSDPSPTPSPSQTEKSLSTTTISEAKSKIASPSPEPSAPQESSKRTGAPPLPDQHQVERRPHRALLDDPKVHQVLAASVLASLRGTIRPQSVVEALGFALTSDGAGMLRALEAGIIKAGDKPGPQAAPEGAVSRYADGTVVEKRGGKWHEVQDDKGKPDEARSQSGAGKKSDPKTRRRQAKALVGKLRERLSQMKTRGASEKEMSVVRSKIKQVKQKMRSMGKSQDPFAAWQRERALEQIKKSADYCKYMGYKRAEQLLYAVAADDTPSEVTVAVKAATRTFGPKFSTLLEKAIK